jgi:PHD/YefM family antitoxin component YafN of YafNO toxin-antitoxin module
MARPLRRVRIVDDSSLLDVLHDVHADRVPRLIERDGEPLAVVLDPSDYPARSTLPTSRRRKSQLLALAGVWRDLDAEQLIADLYRAR